MDGRRRMSVRAVAHNETTPPEKARENRLQDAAHRQRETADYLSDMILELRNLARANQLYTVMVPLEYAYYEAFGVANRVEVPQSELERIKELSKASKELEQAPPQAS